MTSLQSSVITYSEDVVIRDNEFNFESYSIYKGLYDQDLTFDFSRVEVANNFQKKLTTAPVSIASSVDSISVSFTNSDYDTNYLIQKRGYNAVTIGKFTAFGNFAGAATSGTMTITKSIIVGNSFN